MLHLLFESAKVKIFKKIWKYKKNNIPLYPL